MNVGKRVRLRPTLLGMSQEQLGAELNATFQQVQKYERRASRISRDDNADVLNGEQIKDPMARRETRQLVRTYYTIEKPAVRNWISVM